MGIGGTTDWKFCNQKEIELNLYIDLLSHHLKVPSHRVQKDNNFEKKNHMHPHFHNRNFSSNFNIHKTTSFDV